MYVFLQSLNVPGFFSTLNAEHNGWFVRKVLDATPQLSNMFVEYAPGCTRVSSRSLFRLNSAEENCLANARLLLIFESSRLEKSTEKNRVDWVKTTGILNSTEKIKMTSATRLDVHLYTDSSSTYLECDCAVSLIHPAGMCVFL